MNELSWNAYEYTYRPKSVDWFWGVGLVGVTLSILAFIFDGVIFGAFILVTTIAIGLGGLKKPKKISFSILDKGISVGDKVYPYGQFFSFWIVDQPNRPRILLLRQKRVLASHMVIPLAPEIETYAIQNRLLSFIDEEELIEPISHILLEFIGV